MRWHHSFLLFLILTIGMGMGCQNNELPTTPHNPPRFDIQADYAPPNNVGGSDVYLQVPMRVYPTDGPDAVRVVEALYDGQIIASTTNIKISTSITNLFIPFDRLPNGSVDIIVRARSMGGIASQSIRLQVNPARLEQLARDYIHRFWWKDSLGRYVRFISRNIYYLIKTDNSQLADEFREAITEILVPWTGLNFIETTSENKKPIVILHTFTDSRWPHALLYGIPVTKCELYLKDDTDVTFVRGFTRDALKLILQCMGLTNNTSYDDGSIMSWASGSRLLHPYQMKAIRMVYSKPFGAKF